MENVMVERVKTIRKELGLTQEEFAKQIGVSRSNIGNIEYGRVALTDRNITLICKTFNVNENWLRNGIEPIFTENETDLVLQMVKKYGLSKTDKLILENFVKMTSGERKTIIEAFMKFSKLIFNSNNIKNNIKSSNEQNYVNNRVAQSSDSEYIEKEVEAYRLELEAELKGETSEVLESTKDLNKIS